MRLGEEASSAPLPTAWDIGSQGFSSDLHTEGLHCDRMQKYLVNVTDASSINGVDGVSCILRWRDQFPALEEVTSDDHAAT